jgi:hypothetical protein
MHWQVVESQNTELETQLQLAQLQIDELATQVEQVGGLALEGHVLGT